MIIDHVSNAKLYSNLSPLIGRAFEYIQENDLVALPVGKYEIDGKGLFVSIQEYSTKLPELGKWEAHRRYIDLQYLIQGTEHIYYAHLGRLQLGDYDDSKDFLALSGEGDCLTMQKDDFMILFPEDGHMPGMAIDAPLPVKKPVFKITCE